MDEEFVLECPCGRVHEIEIEDHAPPQPPMPEIGSWRSEIAKTALMVIAGVAEVTSHAAYHLTGVVALKNTGKESSASKTHNEFLAGINAK